MVVIRIGTRSSPLALKQTELVIEALVAKNLLTIEECEVVPIKTTGDMIQDRPLYDMGGKALFAKEIETALMQGDIDCAVHSLKDMESILPRSLEIAAVLPRESPWDVWISREKIPLEEMPKGSVVGSCSPRRAAQLLKLRPDFTIKSIRGNIGTRLQQLEDGKYDAIILADAGLRRLNLREKMTERLPLNLMVPAAGQGIIAIECRQTDVKIRSLLSQINHAETFYRMTAERALLKALGGTCRTPIAAFASLREEGMIHLTGVLATEDATQMVRFESRGQDPIYLGREIARELQTRLIKN
ncbi:hydroxymethylbilane synthase [Candidatus Paracaedibacter symbiosus]|uniref:hydroxymethylbilane synthase n=1 Tax=Candidatus Paracaedibacter symbiosus TaxID=244582 RepID=UPI000509EEF0|nr:hydroxymethylbilane synthase [Candidatus Paracaedibacter symbiosus]